MNGIEITTTLTQADWQAYQMAWGQRLQLASMNRRARVLTWLAVAAGSFIFATIAATVLSRLEARVPFVAFTIGVAFCFVTIVIVQRRIQARATPDSDGVILGRCSISLRPEGIRVAKQGVAAEYAWGVVQDATVTTEHLFIWIDRISALIVPLRDFPREVDANTVAREIRDIAAGADKTIVRMPEPPASTATSDAQPATAPVRFKDFAGATARLFTLRTADARSLALSDRAAISLLLSSLALAIGLDWAFAESGSQFHPYGLLVCSWYALVALLVAWLASRLSEPKLEIRPLVLIAIGFAPFAIVVSEISALSMYEHLWSAVSILTALYAVLVVERSLRSLTLRLQPRAIAAALLFVALALWTSQHFYITAAFWYPNYEEYDEATADAGTNYLEQWRASEKTLFEQADRIRASVGALERPGSLDSAAFFLGFAGMGEERVFAGEIELADRIIAERFATRERAVRLVNDRRDMNAHPLASPTALRFALKAIAQKMDLERDVLFLALSSHGSEKAYISVSNSSLPLNNLTATDLADALRAAGIKRRVIVVSACYAGTFIEPLRDDDTIVITASAADRTSFGCSDDRDLTYFGEAFYRDALPTAPTLREAFERAKHLIAEREQAEDKTASNPQAHFGVTLERDLHEHFGDMRSSSR